MTPRQANRFCIVWSKEILVWSLLNSIMDYRDLLAYKKSFELAMKVFEVSKHFPKEEKFSLTDQIRRSSRSVTVTITEAYRKRVYPKNFFNKLSDAEAENSETQVWLDFSLACDYLEEEKYKELTALNNEVGKLIYFMMNNPYKFGSNKI